jgi:hypothetical protein
LFVMCTLQCTLDDALNGAPVSRLNTIGSARREGRA